MATANQIWPIGTDARVVLSGLKDDAGAYIDDATVVGTMKDANGNVVSGAAEVSFTHTAPNGVYSAIVPSDAAFLPDRSYTLFILATSGPRKAMLKMTRSAAHIEI